MERQRRQRHSMRQRRRHAWGPWQHLPTGPALRLRYTVTHERRQQPDPAPAASRSCAAARASATQQLDWTHRSLCRHPSALAASPCSPPAMLQRLSASLRLGRAITAQQRAAFHLSGAVEAGRRKEDSDSEDEANPNAFAAAAAADDEEQLWPPPIDQSQLRNPGGACRRRCRRLLPPADVRRPCSAVLPAERLMSVCRCF